MPVFAVSLPNSHILRRRALLAMIGIMASFIFAGPAQADDPIIPVAGAIAEVVEATIQPQTGADPAARPAPDPLIDTAPSPTPSSVLPTSGPDTRTWARNYLSIAAGVVSLPSYNGSDDRIILPGFYLRGRLSGYAFSTRGTNAQVDLIRQRRGENTHIQFGPMVYLRGDRTARIKDVAVEALGKRKLAAEVGLTAGISHSGVFTSDFDQIGLRVVGLHDVSGRHGSWTVSPTLEYSTPLSKRAYVGMSASINFYGKGFGRYYYDIDAPGSAASGLPVYRAAGSKATLGKYTIGVAGAYALQGDLRKGFVLVGGAQYGRMTGRFAQSPVVRIAGDADQWIFGAGLAYNF